MADSHTAPFEHIISSRETGNKRLGFRVLEDGSCYLNRYDDDGDLVETIFSISAAGVVTFTASNLEFSQDTAVVALTNSTGVTPDDTIGALTAIVAAAGEATAADLTTTQTVRAEILDSLSDLAGKVNEIRAALVTCGIIA